MYLINPESFTQIGSAISESIGKTQQDLPTPWKTLTGAFGSDEMWISLKQINLMIGKFTEEIKVKFLTFVDAFIGRARRIIREKAARACNM